jgi:peptide/nickel transport system permease protein
MEATSAQIRVPRAPAGGVARRERARRILPFAAAGLLGLTALVGWALTPYDALELRAGPPLQAPSLDHPFGTDQFGRDVFSRIVEGFRISLGVAAATTVIALSLGVVFGGMAATLGKFADEGIMRSLDVILAFPYVLLAAVMGAVMGAGWITTVVVLAIFYTPGFARIVRSAVLDELGEDYVVAARVIGSTRIRILRRHVGINAALPVLVFATVVLADAIVLEAALSFIGVGIRPPEPSWGNIMSEGRAFIAAGNWWLTAFPGLAIFVSVLTLNRLSDELRRRLER